MTVVNRVEVCPTLIRTFYQKDAHHTAADFGKDFPTPEIYVYSWIDATLRELSYTIIRSAKLNDVKSLSFMLVIPNLNAGGWILKPLGEVDLTEIDMIETTTLEGYEYRPGYMLDVSYTNNE